MLAPVSNAERPVSPNGAFSALPDLTAATTAVGRLDAYVSLLKFNAHDNDTCGGESTRYASLLKYITYDDWLSAPTTWSATISGNTMLQSTRNS